MDLKRLFYPISIAVVGASPNLGAGKLPYYQLLRHTGYQGRLYPVNPAHKEIDGVKVYPSLDALPEAVDLAIAQAPVKVALETLTAAVRKGVKFIHFFTSGFSELGDTELEKAMLRQARQGGTRIVGPNCIGVLCAESKVTFNPLPKQAGPGKVAFLGQSGGVSLNFLRLAQSRKIAVNKAVSYGNQIDLGVHDFIEYLGRDDAIKVIAAYIEDVKDGRAFISALEKTTSKKPVVILRGGVTVQGARAAASHTGAICGPAHIFSSVMRQFKCIEVQTLEQLLDVMLLVISAKMPQGSRIGYLGAGGGSSVLFSDLAAMNDLPLPELEMSTIERISEKIPRVNTNAANPVDLGAYGRDFNIMAHTMKVMDADRNLDIIMPFFYLEYTRSLKPDKLEEMILLITETVKGMQKPVILVFSKFTENDILLEENKIKVFSAFRDAEIPIFETMGDALSAVKSVLAWSSARH
ncbi:MAG: CoA-binding protein [Deltaproteobacteria bacterium]|nr:CoA-binding protein [Deltaproteobacteria bacterium]